ncbi:MAG: MgtC/SapB family protein [Planctomycetes bacterium]|nr:MgtC/SapB family protein [Planctomycetota bacterium]
MDLPRTFVALGIALGLGLLVGMQRERAGKKGAGSRTFPLITLLGAVCALLAEPMGPWIAVAGCLGVVAALVVSNVVPQDEPSAGRAGMTTEIAMLVMYGVGVLCVTARWEIATAIGGVVFVLLESKTPLHAFAKRLGEDDARAIARFALISLVVLPVLPDRTFDPYAVLNPRRIWMVVVLVVGIGLAAHVSLRTLGRRKGALAGGLLGGLVSSTAATASMARGVTAGRPLREAILVVVLASAMVIPRQLVEIAVIAPSALPRLAIPLVILLAAFLVPCFVAWRRIDERGGVGATQSGNPAEIGPAIVFALVFAAVSFAVALAEERLGHGGLYAIAAIAGASDVDAITLSTAGLVAEGRVDAMVGARAILIASSSNLAGKAAIALALGGGAMFRATALAFTVPLATGIALALAWRA